MSISIGSSHLQRNHKSLKSPNFISGQPLRPNEGDRAIKLLKEDARRNMLVVTPPAAMLRMIKNASEKRGEKTPDSATLLEGFEQLKRRDPLAVLQAEPLQGGKDTGQLTMTRLAPNFEITMYLAQATGACIVTDSIHRWRELHEALMRQGVVPQGGLPDMAKVVGEARLHFPQEPHDIQRLAVSNCFAPHSRVLGAATNYLHHLAVRGRRPNYEVQLTARFARAVLTQSEIAKTGIPSRIGRLTSVFPEGGIRDNTVNRLLLMSSAEHYWDSVPAAFFIDSVNR